MTVRVGVGFGMMKMFWSEMVVSHSFVCLLKTTYLYTFKSFSFFVSQFFFNISTFN